MGVLFSLYSLYCVNHSYHVCALVSGEDYDVPDPFTVTFSSGSLSSSSANVIIINDAILEVTQSFNVTVTGSDVVGFPLSASTVVSIIDNRGMSIFMIILWTFTSQVAAAQPAGLLVD